MFLLSTVDIETQIQMIERRIKALRDELDTMRHQLKQFQAQKDDEFMVPISHIGAGKTFGELALQVNPENPLKKTVRAATV